MAACPEIAAITTVRLPQVRVCEECVKTGDRWDHLRTCQTCGVTLCGDSSPNRHASRHAREHAPEHQIVRSLEPGEDWLWCYTDETLVQAPGRNA